MGVSSFGKYLKRKTEKSDSGTVLKRGTKCRKCRKMTLVPTKKVGPNAEKRQ